MTRSVARIVSGVPPRLRSVVLSETHEPGWDGIRAAGRRCWVETRRSHLARSRLVSGTFEHGVVTDSAPPAAEIVVDCYELEGGAAVGAGE